MTDGFRLRLDVAPGLDATWVVELVEALAEGRGWTVERERRVRPDAVVALIPLGGSPEPVDEPLVLIQVEPGTPRNPVVEESAPHLTPRLDLTVGAFRARRNQRTTLDALERFVDRVERTRPEPLGTSAGPAPDPAEAVDRADAEVIVAENRALLAAVDAWLAGEGAGIGPDTARAVAADRAILAAALTAPVLDLVIIERAATRLATTVAPTPN